jgi:hypothetical protein
MEYAIRRAVERQFPELCGGYHLPCFAQVVAVADAPAGTVICDDFRHAYEGGYVSVAAYAGKNSIDSTGGCS